MNEFNFDDMDMDLDFTATANDNGAAITTATAPAQAPTTNIPVATAHHETAKVTTLPTASSVIQEGEGIPDITLDGLSDTQVVGLAKTGAKKLIQIGSELKTLYVEREAVIADALRALVIGQHVLLLGPPGTGKSALTNEICSRIDGGSFFAWLLNRTSDPAEILGPFSIKAMERDKFLRKTEGKLPEAHIGFLDEIYKCNEPTLNILLSLLNERVFFNDGKPVEVPLISLFAASNEMPEDESLAALHDRLVFRHWVDYVVDPSNRMTMQKNYVAKRNGKAINSSRTTITMQELMALRELSAKLPVQAGVYKTFQKLLNILSRDGIVVSDRRQNECYKIMQGNAVLMGRNEVVLDDIVALKHVLWERKEDIPKVQSEIDKLVNPFDDEIRGLIKKAKEIEDNINSITNQNDKCGAAIEAKGRLEDIIKKMDKVIKEASGNGKDTSQMTSDRDRIIQLNQKLMQDALGLNLSATTNTGELPF